MADRDTDEGKNMPVTNHTCGIQGIKNWHDDDEETAECPACREAYNRLAVERPETTVGDMSTEKIPMSIDSLEVRHVGAQGSSESEEFSDDYVVLRPEDLSDARGARRAERWADGGCGISACGGDACEGSRSWISPTTREHFCRYFAEGKVEVAQDRPAIDGYAQIVRKGLPGSVGGHRTDRSSVQQFFCDLELINDSNNPARIDSSAIRSSANFVPSACISGSADTSGEAVRATLNSIIERVLRGSSTGDIQSTKEERSGFCLGLGCWHVHMCDAIGRVGTCACMHRECIDRNGWIDPCGAQVFFTVKILLCSSRARTLLCVSPSCIPLCLAW